MSDLFRELARELRNPTRRRPTPAVLRRPVPEPVPPRPSLPKYGTQGRRRAVPFRAVPTKGQLRSVTPLGLDDLRALFLYLEGRQCQERRRVSRTRDAAMLALMLCGMEVRAVHSLTLSELAILKMPEPCWQVIAAWLRRRAKIAEIDRTRAVFTSFYAQSMGPNGFLERLNRRVAAARIGREVNSTELRLARPWANLPNINATPLVRKLLAGNAPRTKILAARFPAAPEEIHALEEARARLGLPPFGTAVSMGEAMRVLGNSRKSPSGSASR